MGWAISTASILARFYVILESGCTNGNGDFHEIHLYYGHKNRMHSNICVVHYRHFNRCRQCRPIHRLSFILSRCSYRSIVCCFSTRRRKYSAKIWKRCGLGRLARVTHRDHRNLWQRLLCFWRYIKNRNGLSHMLPNYPLLLLFKLGTMLLD